MQLAARNGGIAIAGMVILAVLALAAPQARGAGGLEYVYSKQKPLPASKIASKNANCPADTQVIGGGVVILQGNTATAIRSSFPIDDRDANERPDDGWRGTAISRSAGNKAIITVAVCSRTGRFSYVEETGLMGPAQTTTFADCPAGESLAGGGIGLFTSDKAMNEGLAAASSAASGDGWFAAGNNLTGAFALIEAWAICARSGSYVYVERTDTAPDGVQLGVAAPCPGGTSVTAGGAEIVSSSTSTELAHSAPYRDGGRQPDDGWQGTINNNNTGGPVDFSTWAVCRG